MGEVPPAAPSLGSFAASVPLSPPPAGYWLLNATVPRCCLEIAQDLPVDRDGLTRVDLLVKDGLVATVRPVPRRGGAKGSGPASGGAAEVGGGERTGSQAASAVEAVGMKRARDASRGRGGAEGEEGDALGLGAEASEPSPSSDANGFSSSPPSSSPVSVNLRGKLVFPTFADLHTHVDKSHTADRSRNPTGALGGADASTAADGLLWVPEELERRMHFALECAYAHGTSAVRTHLINMTPRQVALTWPAFARVREAWRGRVELQGVSLVTLSFFRDAEAAKKLADVVAAHGGLLGAAVCSTDRGGLEDEDWTTCHRDRHRLLDRLFRLAAERGLDVDLHVDENGNPESRGALDVANAVARARAAWRESKGAEEGEGEGGGILEKGEGEGERGGILEKGEGERGGILEKGEGERGGILEKGEGERGGILEKGEGERGGILEKGQRKAQTEAEERATTAGSPGPSASENADQNDQTNGCEKRCNHAHVQIKLQDHRQKQQQQQQQQRQQQQQVESKEGSAAPAVRSCVSPSPPRQIASSQGPLRFRGRVVVGHLCSLAVQTPAQVAETAAALAAVGATVVSLPLVNAWTQDRWPREAVESDLVRVPRHALGGETDLETTIRTSPQASASEGTGGGAGAAAANGRGAQNRREDGSALPRPGSEKASSELAQTPAALSDPAASSPSSWACFGATTRTPRRRGLTDLHALARAGVPVAVASDNVRDQFHAYGDMDMLEVFAWAVRAGHLDRPFGDWPRAVGATPADAMGLGSACRLGPGLPADLVVFRARRFTELLARPQEDRVVVRRGTPLYRRPPPLEDLDDLGNGFEPEDW